MSSNDLSEQATGTIGTRPGFTYSGPDVGLNVNKYHLLLVIERLQKKAKGPSIEHVAIPFAMFLGLLTALIPWYQEESDISPFWCAFTMLLAIFTFIATVVLFVWWLAMKSTQHKETPEQVVDHILDQMAKDQKRLSGISQPSTPDKGESQP